MKKRILAFALIIGLSMATGASANWGKGGRGYANCPQMQGQMMAGQVQQLDQVTQDKIAQFFKDTRPLHKEMAMKKAEKQALMRSDTPDAQAVAKVTGELFDLRTTMQEKAEAAGVAEYVGPGRMGGMMGMGRGRGCCQGPGAGMMQGTGPGAGMMQGGGPGTGMMQGGPQQ